MREEFTNYHPGEDVCPFCGKEPNMIYDRDVAAEDDGAFWVDRSCDECGATWRDYYDAEEFYDYCPECESFSIEIGDGEVEYDTGRSWGECGDCENTWTNYYQYSFSTKD